jgi:hypothetical protein
MISQSANFNSGIIGATRVASEEKSEKGNGSGVNNKQMKHG